MVAADVDDIDGPNIYYGRRLKTNKVDPEIVSGCYLLPKKWGCCVNTTVYPTTRSARFHNRL